MTRSALEANFDGLVGPTHNYAGLSFGNVASANNANRVSNPREAALQGLAKMKALADLGYAQGVLPPQERPSVGLLRTLGFSGDDRAVIREAARTAPGLLGAACSAASMWTANAATVSPSADTADGRVHFTPANLCSKLHRAFEHETTARVLRAAFPDEARFAHHNALPGWPSLGDEGAANHTRLCGAYGERGVEFFVYGRDDLASAPTPRRFPARQTLQASQAIARVHGLADGDVVFAQQHPDAIDAGVFHNDVIAVGNGNVLFCHAQAFVDQAAVLARLRERLAARGTRLDGSMRFRWRTRWAAIFSTASYSPAPRRRVGGCVWLCRRSAANVRPCGAISNRRWPVADRFANCACSICARACATAAGRRVCACAWF